MILVAVLAVVGGLAIVAVTSPQSFQFDLIALITGQASPTPYVTTTPLPTTAPSATPAPSSTSTGAPIATSVVARVTATPSGPTRTPPPAGTPTATEVTLPDNAVALAEVTVQDAENGRVRDLPGGDTVIAIVPNGTQIYVLQGQQEIDDVIWLEVELPNGQTGWMADFLLKILYRRP